MRFAFFFSFFLVLGECNSQNPDPNIVLVNIEQLDREEIANEILALDRLSPKIIAVDIKFDSRLRGDKDLKLVNALWKCKNLIMPTFIQYFGEHIFIGSAGQSEFTPPNAKTGFVNAFLENDLHRTLRKFIVWEQESSINGAMGTKKIEYHFAVRTAMSYDSLKAMKFINAHPKIVEIDYNGGNRRFKKFSANEVLMGMLSKKDIEGKIIVMSFLGPGDGDKFFTPLNERNKEPDMYGGEYLAYVIAQVLKGE